MKKFIILLIVCLLISTCKSTDSVKKEQEVIERKIRDAKKEYVYNLASKYVKPHIAERYVEVIFSECERQNYPFPIKIAHQIETESHFKYWRRSKVKGKYFGHGSMQQSYYWIHTLYWYAKDRNDVKLAKNLKWIEHQTKFNRKTLKEYFVLKHKKKRTEIEQVKFEELSIRKDDYTERTMRYFMRIGYGVGTGIRIMKYLYEKNDNNYRLATLEYWSGRNSDEFKFYSKSNNINKCDYINSIVRPITIIKKI